jgi:multicomponent Na+:H+ antiporter subunit D
MAALLPVLIPLFAAAIALAARRLGRAVGYWALGAALASLAASAFLLAQVWRSGEPVVYQLGGWPAPHGITFVGDLLGATMAVMCQGVIVAGIIYSLGAGDQCIRYPAFYPLFLTLSAGLTGVMLTGDLFNIFVFSELLVISGAGLTAMADDHFGVEAAYKYFYMSLVAGVLLLLAAGSLYAAYGTLNLADLAQRIAADSGSAPLLPAAAALLTAFFMVKSAVVPFHFWQPDFHTAAPTPVSAMLSSVVVKVGVYGFLRMTTLLLPEGVFPLRPLLIALGAFGVLFGGFTALGTHNAKRMLAYSTLAQIGYILVAIGWGSPLALTAALVFTVNHSLVKAAMLMVAGAVASRASPKSAAFTALAGVGKASPFAGGLFMLGGLALAGIPPTNGFVSKLLVFQSGLTLEQYAAVALIGAGGILTLVYVIRAFQLIWWAPLPEGHKAKAKGDHLIAPALLIALCLLLGLWAEPLVRLATGVSEWLLTPGAYIAAVLGG